MQFNGGFPVSPVGYQPVQYQPFYQPQMVQPQAVQPQPVQQQVTQAQSQTMTPPTIRAEIVQVEGEQAAANYPVAAGSSQMMIARDDSAIYVKEAFANGEYRLDVFPKRPPAPPAPPPDYITREEFERRMATLFPSQQMQTHTQGGVTDGTV